MNFCDDPVVSVCQHKEEEAAKCRCLDICATMNDEYISVNWIPLIKNVSMFDLTEFCNTSVLTKKLGKQVCIFDQTFN